MLMEHCLEGCVNKNVVVRMGNVSVQGRLVDYELGAVIVLEKPEGQCIVKDWTTIVIEDVAQHLRALYRPPDYSTSHTDARRFMPVKDRDRLRQKLNETHPPYKKRG
jgi:hypothetical protein